MIWRRQTSTRALLRRSLGFLHSVIFVSLEKEVSLSSFIRRCLQRLVRSNSGMLFAACSVRPQISYTERLPHVGFIHSISSGRLAASPSDQHST